MLLGRNCGYSMTNAMLAQQAGTGADLDRDRSAWRRFGRKGTALAVTLTVVLCATSVRPDQLVCPEVCWAHLAVHKSGCGRYPRVSRHRAER